MNPFVLMLISVILGAIGQLLLKLGANHLQGFTLSYNRLAHSFFLMLKSPAILLGIVFFLTSFVLWVKVLTKTELSYAYPMVSLGYIVIVVVSHFLFNESFTLHKIIGIVVIITGVIIINK
jgi:multidrug transporter EmrE-like cation transporter